MTGGLWEVARASGAAAALHQRASEPRRSVTWCEVERPAVVLGSTQREGAVDAARAAAAGIEVARRRSGGGAVLLVPGQVVWADVIIPAGDTRWDDDVARAFVWLGRAWAKALESLGVAAATVHEDRPVSTPWSRVACFAAMGTGEVAVDGRKVVGVSQRRTRAAALFQCACLLTWEPAALVDVLAFEADGERAALARTLDGAAVGLDQLAASITPEAVEKALLEALAHW
jgi:lipoate-protein ligase A